MAKAVGSLARDLGGRGKGGSKGVSRRAAAARRRGEAFDVQGLLVNERFTKRLMSTDELDEYTLVSEGGRRGGTAAAAFCVCRAVFCGG